MIGDKNEADDEFVIKKLEEVLNTPIPRVDGVRWNTFGVRFKNRKVIELGLYKSNLTKFPEPITKLKHLQILILNNNQITALPDSIGSLQALQKLQMRKNQLKTLPASFAKLQALQKLNLKHNCIESFPTPLLNMKALERLSLGYNQLVILPDSLGFLQSLRKLMVEYNELITLPTTLLNLHSLIRVKFDNNPLDGTSKGIYKTLYRRTYPISYQLKIRSMISLEPDEFIEGFYRTKPSPSWWHGEESEYGYLVLTNLRIFYYQQTTVACLNWIPFWTSFKLKASTFLKDITKFSTGGWLIKHITINERKYILHKENYKALGKKLKKLIETTRQISDEVK